MLKRFNIFFTTLILLTSVQLAFADVGKYKNYSIGITSSSISNDEAGMFSIASPIYRDLYQIKFSLALAYKDGKSISTGTNAWHGYNVYNLGVAVVLREVPGLLRVYAEGGINKIKPSASLSTQTAKIGRYGLVGTELYLNPNSWLNCCSAYVEFGSTGKGLKADQLDGNPTIGHGFVSTVGLRYYF